MLGLLPPQPFVWFPLPLAGCVTAPAGGALNSLGFPCFKGVGALWCLAGICFLFLTPCAPHRKFLTLLARCRPRTQIGLGARTIRGRTPAAASSSEDLRTELFLGPKNNSTPMQVKFKPCPRVKGNDVRFMVTSTTIGCVPTIALHPRIRFCRLKTSGNVRPIGHCPGHIGCERWDGDITASKTVWASNLPLRKEFGARMLKVTNCDAQCTKRIFWNISWDFVQIGGSRDCKLFSSKGIVMEITRLHMPSCSSTLQTLRGKQVVVLYLGT